MKDKAKGKRQKAKGKNSHLNFCLLPFAFCLLPFLSCGYHVGGRGDQIPKDVHTIAVLPFANVTQRYKLDQYLTRAVTHEFIARTRFRITPDENGADATLRGGVTNIYINPIIFDPVSGRATSIQVITQLQVTLTERRSGQVLYQNQNYESRERYEVSTDPRAYFEESELALERMSQSVARNLVSAILEKF